MKNSIQDINTISPMVDNPENKKPAEPVQAEYEEGKRFLENNEIGQAAAALHNALLGFEEKNDQPGIANACNQLGLVCLARKEYENSLKFFLRAYDFCDKSNDRMSLLAVAKQLVPVYRGLEQTQKAIDTCLDMLDWYQDNRNPQGVVSTLELLADIYIDSGEDGKAADAYRTAASIHKNFKHDNIAQSLLDKAAEIERTVSR